MLDKGFHDIKPGQIATTVTYLEMRAQTALRAVALPEGVTFQQVTPTVEWYRDIFDRVGADWLWYGRRLMDDATLERILTDPNVAFYTLSKNGRDEALLELDFREGTACELAYFGVTAELIGSGAGRYLMNKAIELAWSRPITRFHVHTCTHDSPQALTFYIRSGFTPYKRQVEVDDDPRLLGVLPKELAPHIPLLD